MDAATQVLVLAAESLARRNFKHSKGSKFEFSKKEIHIIYMYPRSWRFMASTITEPWLELLSPCNEPRNCFPLSTVSDIISKFAYTTFNFTYRSIEVVHCSSHISDATRLLLSPKNLSFGSGPVDLPKINVSIMHPSALRSMILT